MSEHSHPGFKSDGRVKLGAWCHIPGSFALEIVASAGFDWYCIDRQHGMIDDAAMLAMLQVLNGRGLPAVVRVSALAPDEIGRALDWGANAVIVPMVSSALDARRAASARLFPPAGTRSWGPTRAKLFPPLLEPGIQDGMVACFAMIETEQGCDELSQILEIDGIDGIVLGSHDLLLSLGGDQGALTEAAAAIREGCRRTGKLAGVVAGGSGSAEGWIKEGFEFVAVDSDSSMLAGAAQTLVRGVRQAAGLA
jgi:4-hydroxy-2-oxoheptanedioate aldolase